VVGDQIPERGSGNGIRLLTVGIVGLLPAAASRRLGQGLFCVPLSATGSSQVKPHGFLVMLRVLLDRRHAQ